MSYINISEVDKTIQSLASADNDNIAYVPLNSTDGPSGRYVVLANYSDFVQTFGNDPNPNSALMSSWDYAANLLLRNMPVMVRRITHEIDEAGNDTDVLLEGASMARGLFKIKDVTGEAGSTVLEPVPTEHAFTSSTGQLEESVLNENAVNKIVVSTGVTSTKNTLSVGIGKNAPTEDSAVDTVYTRAADSLANRPVSGQIEIKNTGAAMIKLKYLLIEQETTNSKYTVKYKGTFPKDKKVDTETQQEIPVYLTYDPNLIITDSSNKKVDYKEIAAKWDDTDAYYYLEIPEDYKIAYAEEMSNTKVTMLVIPGDDSQIQINTLVSAAGRNQTELSSGPSINTPITGYSYELPVDENEVFEEAQAFDAAGNLNLFKMYYRFVGNNGSRFSASMRVVDGDGIYLQIWNGTQRLENIQLVSFRYKNENGYWARYNTQEDKRIIWRMFMGNFGIDTYEITEENIDKIKDSLRPLTTEYLSVEINPTIDISNFNYLDDIYTQRGNLLNSLVGGSNPTDDCVIHEVHKTYTPLKDKYLYDIKFVTDGAYVDKIIYSGDITVIPNINRRYIEDSMIELAEARGDCLAFLDIPFELERDDVLDYFQHLSTSYATAYAPWVQLNLLTRTTKWCPPSFAALWTIAKSVTRGNPVYAPPAGVNRANLPEATDLGFQIPSDYLDTWQDNYIQFINPIIYINGYGINIFGQRTLYAQVESSYDNTSVLQYLNVRLVANEVKKRIFKTCIELTFEYNNLHTWLAFKTKMSALLDSLMYNNHITYYNIVMDETTMTDADIRANHIVGTVSIAVSNTAEKFDITFELLPNQVNFLSIDYSVDNQTDSYGSPY